MKMLQKWRLTQLFLPIFLIAYQTVTAYSYDQEMPITSEPWNIPVLDDLNYTLKMDEGVFQVSCSFELYNYFINHL